MKRFRSALAAHRHEIVLLAILLSCYGYFFPRWADWNQNSRFDLVLAIVEDRTVAIDGYVENTGDYAYFGGHYYSDKAPGMALLGVPPYLVFRSIVPGDLLPRLAGGGSAMQSTLRPGGLGLTGARVYTFAALAFTTMVTVAFPSALLGVLLFWALNRLGCTRSLSFGGAMMYSLATIAFPYSNSFVGHQTTAFLLFSAFALLLVRPERARERALLTIAGFCLGYAAITEYPSVLIGALLVGYAVATLRKPLTVLAFVAIGALPPLLGLVLYDYAAFGTPLPVGYAHSSLWTEVHHTGFMSLTYPQPEALWGITFGVHRGLFFLSPFLLFSIPGYFTLWKDRKHRPEFWVLLLAPLAFLLFNGSSVMWQGGYAVGPRYLVPSLPFLALSAGVGMAQAWRLPQLRPLLVLAAGLSFAAVWSETIAGQSFPDYTPNPLVDFSLPRLAAGDIARNAGMLVGLQGWHSLAPLAIVVAASLTILGLGTTRPGWAGRLPGDVKRGELASR